MQDLEDNKIWHVPYYAINITGQDSTIYAKKSESLTRNHLALGELVGFMHNGQQIVGNVIKFNPKSVKLLTTDGKSWNVGYGWLFKIIEGNQPQNRGRLIEGISERVS